jgi:DNA-binding transcriptional ArsR family regulator
MREGPDIARIASLVGDPARANMLNALMGGTALTASELAHEAGVSLPTASSHLGKLMEGGLLTVASQGRHRPGPRDGAMRVARVCYDHLAGEQAVAMLDRLVAKNVLVRDEQQIRLGPSAASHFAAIGIDVYTRPRRPVCRACLDWSVRRSHLAGTLGAAILDKILADKWARREKDSRAVIFSLPGKQAFERVFLS